MPTQRSDGASLRLDLAEITGTARPHAPLCELNLIATRRTPGRAHTTGMARLGRAWELSPHPPPYAALACPHSPPLTPTCAPPCRWTCTSRAHTSSSLLGWRRGVTIWGTVELPMPPRMEHGVGVHTHLPIPACCHYSCGPGQAARAPSGVWQLVLAAIGVDRCGRVGPIDASTPPSMMLATPRAPSGTPLHAPPSVFPKPCDEWCQARCSMAGHSCADLRTAATRTRRLDCGGFAREWHCAAKGGGSPDGPRRVWPSICAPGNASIVPVPTCNRVRGSPPS